MKSILIKNVQIVNRGTISSGDIFIRNGRLEQVGGTIDRKANIELGGSGLHALPGIIDDQVHFREPGLMHKADLYTEPRAAVAGGVTSFMEMPNTKPTATTQALLEEKYQIAATKSLANYSFFMGATNDNIEEVLKTDARWVCGIKIFMGSSTGNMLVDDASTLEGIFSRCPMLIATHCEDEATIRHNEQVFREKYGEGIPIELHPEIRSAEGCLKSSTLAVELAKRHGTRLHILQMIAEQGEMRSQEIMEAINLSQPSVSRYLTQLTATGYLQERRESGAKVYILNKDRIEKTLKAINAFLLNRT